MVFVGTDDNVADFLTKALMGGKFKRFRVDIMGTQDELARKGIFLSVWNKK